MKTKEIQNGIEVYAVDFDVSAADNMCLACCLKNADCGNIECASDLRDDERDVYFIKVDEPYFGEPCTKYDIGKLADLCKPESELDKLKNENKQLRAKLSAMRALMEDNGK